MAPPSAPSTPPVDLDDLTFTLVALLRAGGTGSIMRSVLFDIAARATGRPQMKRLEKKIRRLRHRMALEAAPAPQTHPPANNEPARIRPVADRSRKADGS